MATTLKSPEIPARLQVNGREHTTELLLPSDDIRRRVNELGEGLAEHYLARGGVHVVTVLNGALHFASDLRRSMQRSQPGLGITSDQIRLSSYASTQSSGVIRLEGKLPQVSDEDVLIVEDIYDSGVTLDWLIKNFRNQRPRSLEVAVAISKDNPNRRLNLLGETALHVGFEIPNEFVVGYGLDFDGRYRDIENIYALRPVTTEG